MPEPITLQPGAPATAIPVGPGGSVVLTGQWNLASANLVLDACQSGPPDGPATGPGAIELSRGWLVRSRDWATHRCELVQATPAPDPLCALAGVQGPCAVSNLARIAHALPNPMSVGEMAAQLTGAVRAEVRVPVAVVAPPPPLVEPDVMRAAGAALGLGVLVLSAAWWASARSKRRARVEEQVVALAKKLSFELRKADPVFKRLAPQVEAMQGQARELAALRERLRQRLRETPVGSLRAEVQRMQARGTLSDAQKDQLGYLTEQLAVTERWEREAERAQERLERLRAYLGALRTRLQDDAAGGADGVSERTGVRVEDDRTLLTELEQDVASALEGAREAAALGSKRLPS